MAVLLACGSVTDGSPQHSSRVVKIGSGSPSEGVSALSLVYPGGHLADPPGRCGLSHLREHLAVREAARRLSKLDVPYHLDAFTDATRTEVTVVTAGNKAQFRRVVEALLAPSITKTEPDEKSLSREIAIIRAEYRRINRASPHIAPLVQSLEREQADALLGNCPQFELSGADALFQSAPSAWAWSEMDIDLPLPDQPNDASPARAALLASLPDSAESSDTFLVVLDQQTDKSASLLDAVAFWEGLSQAQGGKARYAPFSDIAFLVSMPKAIKRLDLYSAQREFADLDGRAKAAQRLSAGQVLCAGLPDLEQISPMWLTYRLARDYWARIAVSDNFCGPESKMAATKASQSVRQAFSVIPLPSGEYVGARAPLPFEGSTASIVMCGYAKETNAGRRDYLANLAQILLLDAFRLDKASFAHLTVRSEPDGCARAIATAAIITSSELADAVRRFGSKVGSEGGAELVNRAQRVRCLSVARAAREEAGDTGCAGGVSTDYRDRLGRMLVSARAGPAE